VSRKWLGMVKNPKKQYNFNIYGYLFIIKTLNNKQGTLNKAELKKQIPNPALSSPGLSTTSIAYA